MIINYYYKQHITHQQYKSGMCIYIYQMKKMSILAKSNQKKKILNGLNIYIQIEGEEEKLFNL